MKTEKLSNKCSIIFKGYEGDKINLEDKTISGMRINTINYSDIIDRTGKSKKEKLNHKVILKDKELLYKYKPQERDLILPSTASNSVTTKILLEDQESAIYDSIYASNSTIIRLSPQNSNLAVAMYYLFNLEIMKEKLLTEVYSQGKIKAISLNKLRDFEIPIITNELIIAINEMVKAERKVENLINDILS